MKYVNYLTMMVAAVLFFHCSSPNYFTYSGFDQKLTVALDGDPSIDGDIPVETDGDVTTDVEWDGENPDAPPSVNDDDITENDGDGDGITDDDDEIPELCTSMVVTTKGVSSARVTLNGDDVFEPSDFHNEDITLTSNVNLKEGENELSAWLAGSKGDKLNVRVYNCSVSPSELMFEVTVMRTTGSPNEDGGSFNN